MLKYKPSTQEITTRITMPVVKTLCKNEYGQLLAGTDSGIFQINPETGDIREIHPAVAWDCFPDTGGDIWFATDNGMLALRQHPLSSPFPVFLRSRTPGMSPRCGTARTGFGWEAPMVSSSRPRTEPSGILP